MTLGLRGILGIEVNMDIIEEHSGNKEINVNPDFLDELDFKPINKGLGFHHDRRASTTSYTHKIKRPLVQTSSSLAKGAQLISNSYKTRVPTHETFEVENPYSPILPAFRDTRDIPVSAPAVQLKNEEVKIKKHVPASSFVRTMAFLVDISILVFFYFLCSILLMVALELTFNKIVDGLGALDFIFTNLVMLSFIFIFYFSVLDVDKTIGKYIFKIKVQSNTNQRVNLKMTFFRAIMVLFSFGLLGIPLLLNFHNSITETIVAKEDSEQ